MEKNFLAFKIFVNVFLVEKCNLFCNVNLCFSIILAVNLKLRKRQSNNTSDKNDYVKNAILRHRYLFFEAKTINNMKRYMIF